MPTILWTLRLITLMSRYQILKSPRAKGVARNYGIIGIASIA